MNAAGLQATFPRGRREAAEAACVHGTCGIGCWNALRHVPDRESAYPKAIQGVGLGIHTHRALELSATLPGARKWVTGRGGAW